MDQETPIRPSHLFTLAALAALCASAARADVKPHSLFADKAVLQQGMPVPVWGTADEGGEGVGELPLAPAGEGWKVGRRPGMLGASRWG